MKDLKLDWVVIKSVVSGSGGMATPAGIPKNIQLAAAAKGKKKPTPTIKVEKSNMSVDETRELLQEKDVVDAVLRMPINLIRSVKSTKKGVKNAWGIAAVGAESSKRDGAGVTVAVLDTGIDKNHPAFDKMKIEQRNFCDGEPDDDVDGHGTHCAGTIFGQDVGNTRIGIARKIDRALIGKVIGEDGGASDAIIDAIQWAQSEGAHVISMSLGMDFPGFVYQLVRKGLGVEQATSLALTGYTMNLRMFDRLSRGIIGEPGLHAGSVVTAAAGNESKMPLYTIMVAPPASAEDFVSVAALDEASRLADFSNVGAKLAAPGVDILSASLDGGLETMSGTSMATPHVAGVAALWASELLAAKKSADAAKIVDMMKAKAKSLQPEISERDVAWGMVQAP
ncbi:peptidase S8 [Sinorhizobium meliloti]|uniref:S8 family peptidase n=1 Tax=Rhizobium meliloti TaxID=382 RepID=UPI000FE0D07D|nr:S8 family serine peptidase [Sinorhizobium meliloti]RVG88461.1 peptidase S8 [Sinorhizobium meliloti]RVH60024.1 peptidase S8 [Sinorhizobium meliloti]